MNAPNPNLPALPELMKSQEFFSQVVSMMRQNNMIARLGDGNAFFLTEGNQTKRAFKVKVNLEFGKHFAFPAGASQKPMILGEGYDFINQYSGIEIIRPKTLMAQDGSERGNPYFERDEKTGSINSMFIRGLAIGYSPTGNLVAIDKTIFVNLPTLLVQEIQAKVKRFPFLGQMGTRDQKPTDITFYGDNGKWGRNRVINDTPTVVKAVGAWHFIGLTGDLGYWVNISHPEIQAAFESFSQKQRFLDRSAGTILSRLLLSQHPAIATKTPIVTDMEKDPDEYNKVKSAKAHVFVYGFTADSNPKQKRDDIVSMAERLANGENAANMEIKLEKSGISDVTAEQEVTDISHAEADPTEIQSTPEELFDGGESGINPIPEEMKAEEKAPESAPVETNQAKTETKAPVSEAKPADTETKPPVSETKTPELPDLTKFLNDKGTIRKIACQIRDEMKFDDFSAFRKASPEVQAEFYKKYHAAVAGK